MKKILILYGFEKSGHHAAALALKETFLALSPGSNVQLLNFFAAISTGLEKFWTGLFFRMVKSTPRLWDHLYLDRRSSRRFDRVRQFVRAFAPRGVEDVMRRFKPDAIVCTQAFPCGMINDFKAHCDSNIPLYAVLTDFFAPAYWIYDKVDSYSVASEEAERSLSGSGISSTIIHPDGIPISPRYNVAMLRQQAREHFGLACDLPVVLITGGWGGWGSLEKLACVIAELAIRCQVVLVTGRNRALFERLSKLPASGDSRIKLFEYVRRMDILMKASDVLVGKAGGLTAAEALAARLPMVLVDSLPGQENANSRVLARWGAARTAFSVEGAAALVKEILSSAEKLEAMRDAAARHARPDAAFAIAGRILETNHAYVAAV